MWIKTDSNKLINTEQYQGLEVEVVPGASSELYPVVCYYGDSLNSVIIASCVEAKEADLILSNIFYSLKQGEVAVDVADLRDVDLGKIAEDYEKFHIKMFLDSAPKRCKWWLKSKDKG